MNAKVILNVRTDAKIKKAAQRAAKELGVPLSVVVNASLRAFVRDPHLDLEPLIPNARTRRAIDAAMREFREGKAKQFHSIEELRRDLDS